MPWRELWVITVGCYHAPQQRFYVEHEDNLNTIIKDIESLIALWKSQSKHKP